MAAEAPAFAEVETILFFNSILNITTLIRI
jgi:hypothetical protein